MQDSPHAHGLGIGVTAVDGGGAIPMLRLIVERATKVAPVCGAGVYGQITFGMLELGWRAALATQQRVHASPSRTEGVAVALAADAK